MHSKNPATFLEFGANVAAVTASRNPKAALSALPEVINFYHTGKGLYLSNFVYFISYKWKRKQIEHTQVHP